MRQSLRQQEVYVDLLMPPHQVQQHLQWLKSCCDSQDSTYFLVQTDCFQWKELMASLILPCQDRLRNTVLEMAYLASDFSAFIDVGVDA